MQRSPATQRVWRLLLALALALPLFGMSVAAWLPDTAGAEGPNAVQNIAGCNASAIAANDDGSSPQTPLGFTANFFGTSYTQVYVNNNGNVTFDTALSAYTATPIQSVGKVIIAPFWADVDTRGVGNSTTKYGPITYDGRPAFCVNWINVGYYSQHTNKLNSFQLILVDRGDTGANNFDIVMNYDKIQWETGDLSGGSNGLGGNSVRVGYSNGSNTSFELPGSAVNGALLDTHPSTALIKNSRNTSQLGRYIYQVRSGAVASPSPIPSANPSPAPGSPACLTPGTLDFGTQTIGNNAPAQLALLNNCGSVPLAISSATLGGTNAGDFEIVSSCTGTTVPTGATCGIRALFHPAAVGVRSATVTVAFAGGTAVLNLTGTGALPVPPFDLNVLTNGNCTVGIAPNPGPYTSIMTVTLTPQPAAGWVFVYWRSERGFMGWADPWTFQIDADHTVTAHCVPIQTFPDYAPSGAAKNDPVIRMTALNIIKGYGNGNFGPNDTTQRAQMAALICRGMGFDRPQTWDQEDHGNPFTDRNGLDANLWRNVGTLYYYNVGRGYDGVVFGPTDGVNKAQTISFFTRAMVLNGYWVQQPDNPALYPNVPASSGHRSDIATYVFYAGTVPGTSSSTQNWGDWNAFASRLWFSEAEWKGLNDFFTSGYTP